MMFIFILFFLSSFSNLYSNDVTVSIAPQKFLVDYISSSTLKTYVIYKSNYHTHDNYRINFNTIYNISKSKVYLYLGVKKAFGFENNSLFRLIKKNNPTIRLVNISEAVKVSKNIHIWLSLNNLIKMSNTVYISLCSVFPEKRNLFNINYQKLVSELNSLKNYIKENKGNYLYNEYFCFHSIWSYLSNEIGVNEVSLYSNSHSISLVSKHKFLEKIKLNKSSNFIVSDIHELNKSKKLNIKNLNIHILNPLDINVIKNIKRFISIFNNTKT